VGVVPEKGNTMEPMTAGHGSSVLGSPDTQPAVLTISADGHRVFFETTAQLVPQDSNVDTLEEEAANNTPGKALDVYEWEAAGSEEAPGVFCHVANGCTHLISAGEGVGPDTFLGASSDGRDVFFSSQAQLVPQASAEFMNIYDARIGGGFPVPASPAECTSCQGLGGPPPQFAAGASAVFSGAGNPSPSGSPGPLPPLHKAMTRSQLLASALRACRRPHRKRRVACERAAHRHYAGKSSAGGRR
jgi:hypothetical protein